MSRYKNIFDKSLDKTYVKKLDPVLKKIQKGTLPTTKQMDLVSKITEEIQEIPFQYLPETCKYITRISEQYNILKNEKYRQGLGQAFKKAKKKLLESNNLTDEEIKRLQKRMKELAEEMFFYDH